MKIAPENIQTELNTFDVVTPGDQLDGIIVSLQDKGEEVTELTVIMRTKSNRYYVASQGVEYDDEVDAKIRIAMALERYLKKSEQVEMRIQEQEAS